MKYINALFRTRINRKTFILGNIFLFFLFLGIPFLTLAITIQIMDEQTSSRIMALVVAALLAPFLLLFFSLQIRRWHDIGKSALWMLLGGIPYIGLFIVYLYLSLEKGDDKENRYGSSANPDQGFLKTLFNPQNTNQIPNLVFPEPAIAKKSLRLNLSQGLMAKFGQLACTDSAFVLSSPSGETKIERKKIIDITVKSWLLMNSKITIVYKSEKSAQEQIQFSSGELLSTNIITTKKLFYELKYWQVTGQFNKQRVLQDSWMDRLSIGATVIGMFATPTILFKIFGDHGGLAILLEFYFGGVLFGFIVSALLMVKVKNQPLV